MQGGGRLQLPSSSTRVPESQRPVYSLDCFLVHLQAAELQKRETGEYGHTLPEREGAAAKLQAGSV